MLAVSLDLFVKVHISAIEHGDRLALRGGGDEQKLC